MVGVDTRPDSDESATENEELPKVQRTARLRKSCELCRTQKARCIASEGSDRCQRCARNDSKCVFLAAKARPKKAMSSKARVAEMEQKLDGLMAMLEARKASQTITPDLTPTPPDHDTMPPLSQERLFVDQQRLQLPIRTQNDPPFSKSLITPPWSLTPSIDGFSDVISKGIVSFQEAEEYVRWFRRQTVYFPFVVVPMSATLDSLRRERPFLLLVIILFGCAQTFNTKQKTLDNELLEIFAKRSVVDGEKSMDLLQGLLVYCAQYHYFFNPQRQQIYQNSQLLISMATILGINKPADTASSISLNVIAFLTPRPYHHKLNPMDPECRRTICGVYVISAAVARVVRQANNMKYTAFIGECCSFLSQASLSEHDHLIQYFVRMQQVQDEVVASFDYDGLNDLPKLECAKIETLLRSFNTQLQHLQDTFPKEIWNNPQIMLKFHYIQAYLFEIAFHTDPPPQASMDMKSWYHSATRTSTLLSCLFAAKSYVEYVIELPTPVFLSMGSAEFCSLIYCVLILGCFATPNGPLSLTLSSFQEVANLQFYLDALVTKTHDLIATGTAPGYLFHFNLLFRNTHEWYAGDPTGPGVRGRCITDLVADMFPVGSRYAPQDPMLLQYGGTFNWPEIDQAVGQYVADDDTTELWPDMDAVLGEMWTGEGEFGTGSDPLPGDAMNVVGIAAREHADMCFSLHHA